MNIKNTCHDCGVKEGQIHECGCDMEDCPFCGRQLIGCCCCYHKLGINISEGSWAYNHGLTKLQQEKWLEILTKKGRIPYVIIPVICKLCGKDITHNELHNAMLSNKDWEKYIIPPLQQEVLCLDCINKQKQLFPNGWKGVK